MSVSEQKWKYLIKYRQGMSPENPNKFNGRLSDLNNLGEQGWELVAVNQGEFFFKRPTAHKDGNEKQS